MQATNFHASRRALMCGGLALAAGLCLPFSAVAGFRSGSIDPLLLMDEKLARLMIDSLFTFIDGDSRLVTRLHRVDASAQPLLKGIGTTPRSFALEFVPVDGVTRLQQGTYAVESHELGQFELFVVPQRNGKDQTALLATFNRL